MVSHCAIASRPRKRLLSQTHPRSRETEAFYVHVANGSVTFQMQTTMQREKAPDRRQRITYAGMRSLSLCSMVTK